ncbi:MAG: head-tail adaptor protein [Chloroflexota bacterium]
MKLGSRTTNPGEMRTPVLFQTTALAVDAGNAQSLAYTDLKTLYVKWINAHGPEAVSSDALKSTKRATVTCRYLSSINETVSIVKDGERWQVISIDDIQERHEYLELIVERAKGSL